MLLVVLAVNGLLSSDCDTCDDLSVIALETVDNPSLLLIGMAVTVRLLGVRPPTLDETVEFLKLFANEDILIIFYVMAYQKIIEFITTFTQTVSDGVLGFYDY